MVDSTSTLLNLAVDLILMGYSPAGVSGVVFTTIADSDWSPGIEAASIVRPATGDAGVAVNWTASAKPYFRLKRTFTAPSVPA